MKKKILAFILLMLLSGSVTIQAFGETFPAKPVEIVCTFTPGSSMDLMARIIADIAPKYLGQPVVVVNKPGASGAIGAAEIVSSKPDGYKLVTASNVLIGVVLKTMKIPFDPYDLYPIANFMEYKFGLAVKGNAPWRTLSDLLDYASKNPQTLRWCHPGRGTTLQINALMIFRKAGVQAIETPYKGSPEMLSALLGGHMDVASIAYGAISDQVRSGNLRYLTFYSDRRFSEPSNVPCAAELGFPEAARLPTLVGLYAHKNTPEAIRKTLYDAFKKTYEDPAFKKGFEKFGEEPRFEGPDFLVDTIKKSDAIGTPILKELGLYVGK